MLTLLEKSPLALLKVWKNSGSWGGVNDFIHLIERKLLYGNVSS